MPSKKSKHVRRFLSAAIARREEAELLRSAGKSLGAVYLAGYAVECLLKSLILSLRVEHQQLAEIASFRGARAHDYEWLRQRYRKLGGANFPESIALAFNEVSVWETDLRYSASQQYNGNLNDFLDAVYQIENFVRRRI